MARKSPPETLRNAVDRTVHATVGQAQMTRERAQELVDELAGAAGRVREALDDLRLATGDDVKALGARLAALERRVAELETATPATPVTPAKAAKPAKAKGPKRGAKAKAKGKA